MAASNCCFSLIDDQGCQTDTCLRIDFVEPLAPFATVVAPLCQGAATGSLTFGTLGGRAPYNYQWSNSSRGLGENGVFAAEGDSLVLDGLFAGDYQIRLSDAFFDTTFTLSISEPQRLALLLDQVNPISCYRFCDGNFSISHRGGTGAVTLLTVPPTTGFGCAGTYFFEAEDANGCQADTSYTLVEPTEFIASVANFNNVSCFGGTDGRIAVATNGSPQAYLWSHGPTTAAVAGLAAGTYSLTVTNNDGCPDTLVQRIDEPSLPLRVNIALGRPITCADDADGVLQASSNGQFGRLAYSWSDGQNTAVALDLGPGQYSVLATDERGCQDSAAYTP
ncbi:MAG: hypothetical protein HC821_03015 [Lewinella sp.]|nr:hypothetical protein [Lewinella sp.]